MKEKLLKNEITDYMDNLKLKNVLIQTIITDKMYLGRILYNPYLQ